MSVIKFSELQQDAIVELVNLGIGKAAKALSDIIREEVILSVPEIKFVNYDDLLQHMKDIDGDTPAAVTQSFSGDFSGKAMLLFPEQSGISLVKQMLRGSVTDDNIASLEEEALMEIGNIILNACFGQIGNLLSTDLDGSLPHYLKSSVEVILNEVEGESATLHESQTLLLQVDFSLHESKTKGFVIFAMDVSSLSIFKQKIDQYLQKIFR